MQVFYNFVLNCAVIIHFKMMAGLPFHNPEVGFNFRMGQKFVLLQIFTFIQLKIKTIDINSSKIKDLGARA